MEIKRTRDCQKCGGKGAPSPRSNVPCDLCGGTGTFILKDGVWKPFNPHNSLLRVNLKRDEFGHYIDHRFRCRYCKMIGLPDYFEVNECSYTYPPCRSCGLTPLCTQDCVRLGLAEMGQDVLGLDEILPPEDQN